MLLLASLASNVVLVLQLRKDNKFLCKDGMFISNDPSNLKKMANCMNSQFHCKKYCIDKSGTTMMTKDCIDCLNIKNCGVKCNTDVSNFTCDNGIFINSDDTSLKQLETCIQNANKCKTVCQNSSPNPNTPPTPDCLKCLHTNNCGVTC